MKSHSIASAFFGALAASVSLSFAGVARADTLLVGPGQMYATSCQAIQAAHDGDAITIDAAGDYTGDVCDWGSVNGLTVTGINGRPHIDGGGKIAGDKGTWAISGNDITIVNVEISGAHSANGGHPDDQNGAGIRAQGKNITVDHCYIHDNDDGFLGGGPNDGPGSVVSIQHTEFAHNGFGDGKSHNVYVNSVDMLTFQYNYSHDVAEGHLLKTRATHALIAYNRISTEAGTDSYEIDIPNGGVAYVIGNVVVQDPTTHNPAILSFAEEGSHTDGTPDQLYVVNNTFVNRLGSGNFVTVAGGVTTNAVLENNVFFGGGTECSQMSAVLTTNLTDDPHFTNADGDDFHLTAGSPAVDAGTAAGPSAAGFDLTATKEYVHPVDSAPRSVVGAIDIGAYELDDGHAGAPSGTAGAPASNGGSPASNGGSPSSTGGSPSNGGSPASTGGSPASTTGGAKSATGGSGTTSAGAKSSAAGHAGSAGAPAAADAASGGDSGGCNVASPGDFGFGTGLLIALAALRRRRESR